MISIGILTSPDFPPELFNLSRQFFEEYRHHHPYFFIIDHLSNDHIRSYFSRFLNKDDAAAFIASDTSNDTSPIIGYLTVSIKDQPDFWVVKRVGEISGLMVAKPYRRKGIASKLLRRAKVFLADRGIHHLTAFTAVANKSALSFYSANNLELLYLTVLGNIESKD